MHITNFQWTTFTVEMFRLASSKSFLFNLVFFFLDQAHDTSNISNIWRCVWLWVHVSLEDQNLIGTPLDFSLPKLYFLFLPNTLSDILAKLTAAESTFRIKS